MLIAWFLVVFKYKIKKINKFFIKKLRKILAVPIVDGLDWNNLEHTNIYGNSNNRGIFEWGFLYKEAEVPPQEVKRHKFNTEPYW